MQARARPLAMHGTRISLERSGSSFQRAKVTAQRLNTRAPRRPERPRTPALEHALAFRRYLCLLLEEGKIAQLQLTLSADLSDETRAGLMALFHSARVMAFAVDDTTLLAAAGLPMARALANLARRRGSLGRKLQARLKDDFGSGSPVLSHDEQQRMAHLKRALAAITRIDLPRPNAFADAGFDLATIYSSRRSR
jgi:hypothetical protein